MKENDFFDAPIITPTTKAHVGHDEDISREEIISSGLIPENEYVQLEKYALALFERGREIAKHTGLILVDTKYEFGKIDDTIYLIDEIHTPDSSRYFYLEGYEERQKKGESQRQLSKEFVREWLMENGFQGQEGQQIPEMTESVVGMISERYIELYEVVTGKSFLKMDMNFAESEQKIIESLNLLEAEAKAN
jgi:phosphoribosylaminoimidazole-succinocarboxamide synthase